MNSLFLLLTFSATSMALESTDLTLPSHERLVEVSFRDDPPSSQSSVTLTFYIAERERGKTSDTQHGIDGSSYTSVDADLQAARKAEQCLLLLASTARLKELPPDPREVITVRWMNGWLNRQFPVKRVPAEVREILLTMGFRNDDFKRLTFVE